MLNLSFTFLNSNLNQGGAHDPTPLKSDHGMPGSSYINKQTQIKRGQSKEEMG